MMRNSSLLTNSLSCSSYDFERTVPSFELLWNLEITYRKLRLRNRPQIIADTIISDLFIHLVNVIQLVGSRGRIPEQTCLHPKCIACPLSTSVHRCPWEI